jgi:hypothetical protein
MKRRIYWIVGWVVLLITTLGFSAWAVPGLINYQGKLTDEVGTSLDGTYTVHFYLYDALTGGDLLWDEQQSVAVTDGVYNVQLGSVSPLKSNVFAGGAVYLEVLIYDAATTSWETLSPRQPLTSTAYAFQAENAQALEGYGSADFSPLVHGHSGADITSGTVDEARIDPAIARDSEISWDNLSGIPSDIADGDQLGITIEKDPTVDASVKDGVSWSELSGIPADIADGDNDSGGDITGVTAGDGLFGGGDTGTVTLEVSNPLRLTNSVPGAAVISGNNSSSGWGVWGSASGSSGRGVYGLATGSDGWGVQGTASNTGNVTNYGGYFEARGEKGRAVYGEASNEGDVENFGGYFVAEGTSGIGVYGRASNEGDVVNYGGFFRSYGVKGRGVYGWAPGTNGSGVYGVASNTGDVTNYGGYFATSGKRGLGVYGLAGAATGITYGVRGETYSTAGRGVYGRAFASGGTTYGVAGRSDSPDGYGLWGKASATGSASNTGVYGEAAGTHGVGVYGKATNTGDVSNRGGYFRADGKYGRGVEAYALGANGVAVFAEASNKGDVTNYGGYFAAKGSFARGVQGEANNTGDVENYGGYFLANGEKGRGVYGKASGTYGYGVFGRAEGTNGWGLYGYATGVNSIGVRGYGGKYDFYAGGPGTNYVPFTGAHEVRFAEDIPGEIRPGMIVSVTGRAEVRKKETGEISLSSTLPTVTLSQKARDKAVFGVLVSEGPLAEDHWYEADEGERFGVVNALGEGRMWVTNAKGDIEAGDYITSSAIPGYGQRQEDDLVHSYTVGKAIETVDWDAIEEKIEYQGGQVKIYLIAVVYTSG